MKTHPLRRIAAVAGLIGAGAFFGAAAAVITAFLAFRVVEGEFLPLDGAVLMAIAGAILGVPLFPIASLLLMRRVPRWHAIAGTTFGTVVGGVLGCLAAMPLNGPVVLPLVGAIAGFCVAVARLRERFEAPMAVERVRVPAPTRP